MSGGFEALGLMPELLQSVSELGWTLPTGVQDEAIPLILGGGDVMVASETGTGKTAAFCLPVIQCVHERLAAVEVEVEVADTTEEMKGPRKIRLSTMQCDPNLVIAEDGLSCSSTESVRFIGARGTFGVKKGKYYFEVTLMGPQGCRIGWATNNANLELGKDSLGFGYGSSAFKSNDAKYDKYGKTCTTSDVMGCYLDWDARTISYSVNGTHLGNAFTIPKSFDGCALFPAIAVQGGRVVVNYGGNVPFKSFVDDNKLKEHSAISEAKEEDIVVEPTRKEHYARKSLLPLAIIVEPAKELAEQVCVVVCGV